MKRKAKSAVPSPLPIVKEPSEIGGKNSKKILLHTPKRTKWSFQKIPFLADNEDLLKKLLVSALIF